MFPADADLQVRSRAATERDTLAHQRAHALSVEHLERIVSQDLLLEIDRNEAAFGVIAAVAIGRLRQVIGPKREELRDRRQFVRNDTGARKLDHRADVVLDARAALRDDLVGNDFGRVVGNLHLFLGSHARNHHVGPRIDAARFEFARRFKNRADLHCVDLGKKNAQPADAQSQHRVLLVELLHTAQHRHLLLVGCVVRAFGKTQFRRLDEQLIERG